MEWNGMAWNVCMYVWMYVCNALLYECMYCNVNVM